MGPTGPLQGGIITVLTGAERTCKSSFALGMAVAVGSGTPALGYFHVPISGPVPDFSAEDDPRSVRHRVIGLGHGDDLEFSG